MDEMEKRKDEWKKEKRCGAGALYDHCFFHHKAMNSLVSRAEKIIRHKMIYRGYRSDKIAFY